MGIYGSPDLTKETKPKAYCRYCGNALYHNIKKCSQCNKKQDKSKWYLWLIIFILFVACFSNITSDVSEQPTIAKEEYINMCENINYKDIARNPNNYINKYVKYTGKVIQVSENYSSVILRVNVTRGEFDIWEDTIYCTYKYKNNESKILEDDIIELYGVCKGTTSYTSILGASITIPKVDVEYWVLK